MGASQASISGGEGAARGPESFEEVGDLLAMDRTSGRPARRPGATAAKALCAPALALPCAALLLLRPHGTASSSQEVVGPSVRGISASAVTTATITTSQVLEPPDGVTVHCAGQDRDSFSRYSEFMDDGGSAPSVFMAYVRLDDVDEGCGFFASLRDDLAVYEAKGQFLIPHIGLEFPLNDGLPRVLTDPAYQTKIDLFIKGMKEMDRPSYLRPGYEFNGEWNMYDRKTFVKVWDMVVGDLRKDPKLARNTAVVWNFGCDAVDERQDYMSWYSYENQPNWWSTNVFGEKSLPHAKCIKNFVADAKSKGFPVMMAETAPRFLSVNDAPWAAVSLSPSICLGTPLFSVNDGQALHLWPCAGYPKHVWRFSPEGYLINQFGKCIGANGFSAVTTECGGLNLRGEDPGVPTLKWRLQEDGIVAVTTKGYEGFCLKVFNHQLGAPVHVVNCSHNGGSTMWDFRASPATYGPPAYRAGMGNKPDGEDDGNVTWQAWFQPYLELLDEAPVKAFCYIDWMWAAWSNHDCCKWYNWQDNRVENTRVGERWRRALASGKFVNGDSRAEICRKLGCSPLNSSETEAPNASELENAIFTASGSLWVGEGSASGMPNASGKLRAHGEVEQISSSDDDSVDAAVVELEREVVADFGE